MGGLPWVRLDTTLPDHPKVLELLDGRDGFRGFTVYVCSVAYSGRHGTDGVLRRSALPAVHGRLADARRLVEVDLWHGPGHECPECPDPPEGGWAVHNYLARQQGAVTTDSIRAARRQAGAKGNCARWHEPGCRCTERGGLRGLG